jgi:hypothetical protein
MHVGIWTAKDLRDLDVNVRVILKLFFREFVVRVWTGFIWL